jgi:hypothetical protein
LSAAADECEDFISAEVRRFAKGYASGDRQLMRAAVQPLVREMFAGH